MYIPLAWLFPFTICSSLLSFSPGGLHFWWGDSLGGSSKNWWRERPQMDRKQINVGFTDWPWTTWSWSHEPSPRSLENLPVNRYKPATKKELYGTLWHCIYHMWFNAYPRVGLWWSGMTIRQVALHSRYRNCRQFVAGRSTTEMYPSNYKGCMFSDPSDLFWWVKCLHNLHVFRRKCWYFRGNRAAKDWWS